ncbi:MipA/OmpV family protein [Paraferrimonas sedimenticola]|uniref:MltA-interacting MipA family protein n=1 Tax=Paraferrimonas sedimenticola TaxID=375674 RepID=A0AA37W235_9GAMM|nr:MipA/OmpV family protein [Paraferrimonas sedimenticola]GLP97287.1 MltA-interacting MipA family protein [Paraferrimonas sedimenticola]
MKLSKASAIALALMLSFGASANTTEPEPDNAQAKDSEPKPAPYWGVAIGVRNALIPYETAERTVLDVVPLLTYRGEIFYIEGVEGGAHLWEDEGHQVNYFAKYRFFDIPRQYQNQFRGSALDHGLQYRYEAEWDWHADVSLLSDTRGNFSLLGRAGKYFRFGRLDLHTYLESRWKSASYNRFYFAFNRADTKAGVSIGGGVEAKYKVWDNLHLIGQAGVTQHERAIKDLPTVKVNRQFETYLGFGFYPTEKQLTEPFKGHKGHFVRVSHGWGTTSNLGDILAGKWVKDPYNNQLTSAFYGIPIATELLTLPLDVYFTSGLAYHYESQVQKRAVEGVIALKAFVNVNWPRKWRFGVAQGLSYISDITYVEGSEMDRKGYRPSKLLNYLDFSLGINLGDWFSAPSLNPWWVGVAIHHRSGIFESSSAFGRIGGGSNYNTLFVQYHF